MDSVIGIRVVSYPPEKDEESNKEGGCNGNEDNGGSDIIIKEIIMG